MCSALQQFGDSSASTGHRECMETLLAHEVDIDQEDQQHGTPLYMACTYQRTDCVKKLLELGTPGKGARGELWWCEPMPLLSLSCLST